MAVVVALGGGAEAWRAAAAEPARIVVLTSHTAAPYEQTVAGFRQYLRQQGLEVSLEIVALDGDRDRGARVAQDARKSRAALLLTLGTLATQSALQAGVDLPVVAGLIVSPDDIRPAGNATGVSLEFPFEVQFQWLRRFLPAAKTVGVLYNPAENQRRIAAAGQAAERLGLRLEAREVQAPREIPTALETLGRTADVLWTVVDSLLLAPQTAKELLLFSFRNRIPVAGLSAAWAKSGALYALEWDYGDVGVQCGEVAVKILQGVRASSIPVAPPRKVVYVLNQRIANHLKVELPEQLVRGAREVF